MWRHPRANISPLSGSSGTSTGLSLRLGQIVFSSASLLFMSVDVNFYSNTAFCYLVTTMALVIPWSLALAVIDGCSVFLKCPIRQPGLLLVILTGDWVLSLLILAAAASTAGVVDLLNKAGGSQCNITSKLCNRYQISAAMAFLLWILTSASTLFNFWLLPAL